MFVQVGLQSIFFYVCCILYFVFCFVEQVGRGVHRGPERPVVPAVWGRGVGRAGQEPRQLGQLRGLLPGEGTGTGGEETEREREERGGWRMHTEAFEAALRKKK